MKETFEELYERVERVYKERPDIIEVLELFASLSKENQAKLLPEALRILKH